MSDALENILNSLPSDVQLALRETYGENVSEESFQEVLIPSSVVVSAPLIPNEMNAIMNYDASVKTLQEQEVPFTEVSTIDEHKSESGLVALKAIEIVETPLIYTKTDTQIPSIQEEVSASDVINQMNFMTPLQVEETILDESLLRFSGADWFQFIVRKEVSLIGAGGIGSWVAVLLAKLGCIITVFDKDDYDKTNIAGQLFLIPSCPTNKAFLLSQFCKLTTDTQFYFSNRNWVSGEYLCALTISAVDNMKTRKELFETWVSVYSGDAKSLFIDGRLAAETYQLYSISGADKDAIKKYQETALFNDEEADELQCSFKQTAFMAALLGGRIVNNIVNFYSPQEGIPRVCPFYIEYDAFGYQKIVNYATEL